MGMLYEKQRKYIWAHGWRPFKMLENGRIVLAWKHKKHKRECQDIDDAYRITKFNVEVTKLWQD